jgi:hypothetical protein
MSVPKGHFLIQHLQPEPVARKLESITTAFLIMLMHLLQHRPASRARSPITQPRRIALGASTSDPLEITVTVTPFLCPVTLKLPNRLPAMGIDAVAAV